MPSNGPVMPCSSSSSMRACTNRTDGGHDFACAASNMPRASVDGDDFGFRSHRQQRGRRRAGAAAGIEQPWPRPPSGRPHPTHRTPQVGVIARIGADQLVVGVRAGVKRIRHVVAGKSVHPSVIHGYRLARWHSHSSSTAVTSAKPNKKSSIGNVERKSQTAGLPLVVDDDGCAAFCQPAVDWNLETEHDHHRQPVGRPAKQSGVQQRQLQRAHSQHGDYRRHGVAQPGHRRLLRSRMVVTAL